MDQVRHLYHTGHYKNAFKACSGLLKLAAGDRMSRISVMKAVDRINSELLSSLGDEKVKKSTIHDAISRGLFGMAMAIWLSLYPGENNKDLNRGWFLTND